MFLKKMYNKLKHYCLRDKKCKREIKVFKGVRFFVACVFASLLCSVSASAISLSSLEQISEPTEKIEINTPEEGYDFDANFLAKDQELQYKATIANDEELPVKIDSISLNESEYNFLEYSFEGIAVDDVIKVGETRDVFVIVKTNENDTSTVSEDYNLTLTYTQVKPEPQPGPQPGPEPTPDDPDTPDTPDEPENPETATTAVIKTGTIALISIGAIVFVFVRNKRIRQYAIVFTLSSLGIFMFASSATAEEAASTLMIHGKVRFTNVYTVTVDPNGGTYNGELTATRREGETYHIEEVARDHFNFVEWEINPSNTPDANNNIEIHANTTLKAKWNENTYTLTIKPNGGEYLDSEEDWHQSYRPGQSETIATPEKEGYNFVNWTVEKGSDTVGEDGIFTGDSVTMYEDVTLVANYEIKKFTVTIIPNGGTYEGELQTTVDWNTDYEILSISKDGNDLKDWTKTVGETSSTLASDTEYINIKADTTLEANWWSSTFYTVTIVPNGGTYAGDLETQVRAGQTYTMQDISHDNAIFDYWHYTDTDTRMNDSEFVVNDNISLTAEWLPIVAKIVRTNVVYPSIMAAHEEAESGDTIELLVDTTEIVTNEKNITLDLGAHTVTGYLINTSNGNLTLLNGAFDNYEQNENDTNNPNGAAVINNGTLTLGIDDYEENDDHNRAAKINHNYVRLYGNTVGMQQNATLNYYDGIIEGVTGLVGGADSTPWYRTMDEVEQYKDIDYYPFVSKNPAKNQQHVQLESSNLAVSKTIDEGEVYYYDLQDNINASAVTGYKIYAVRDFPANYSITVPENTTIDFDITGYDITATYDWQNNGTFNIMDSKFSTDAGSITFERSFANSGTLNLKDINMSPSSNNTMLLSSGTINLENAHLSGDTATVIELTGSSSTLNADDDSEVSVTNSNYYAVNNNSAEAVIDGGNYVGNKYTIYNQSSKKLTIKDGYFSTNPPTSTTYIIYNNGGTLEFEDGTIEYGSDSNAADIYGLFTSNGTVKIYDGTINIKNKGTVNGIRASNAAKIDMYSGSITVETLATSGKTVSGIDGSGNTTINIEKGENSEKSPTIKAIAHTVEANGVRNVDKITNAVIEATSDTKAARGVYEGFNAITDSTITATSTSGDAYGARLVSTINSGTITGTSKSGVAYGVYAEKITINGGTIIGTSDEKNAYGLYGGSSSSYSYTGTINGGTITGTTKNSEKLGYGVFATQYYTVKAVGGNITGTNIGISATPTNKSVTLGNSEDAINKNAPIVTGGDYGLDVDYINFYDGTVIGGTDSIRNRDNIMAIADGAETHTEIIDGMTNTWLIESETYLHNDRLNEDYNSFNAAYGDERFQDGDTLTVTKDYSTEAVHPDNTHTVTINLDGHTLTYTQPLKNSGNMTIVGGEGQAKGKIVNTNVRNNTIDNEGDLTINNSELTSACIVVNKTTTTKKNLVISDSKLSISSSSSGCNTVVRAYDYTKFELNNSTLEATSKTSTDIEAIYAYDSKIYITGSTITVSSEKSSTNGVYVPTYGAVTVYYTNSTITSSSETTAAYGMRKYGSNYSLTVNMYSGYIEAFSGTDKNDPSTYASTAIGIAYAYTNIGKENGQPEDNPRVKAIGKDAYGLGGARDYSGQTVYYGKIETIAKNKGYSIYCDDANIYGGIIDSYSYSDLSYGVFADDANIYGGSISAKKEATDIKAAVGIKAEKAKILGGTIYGQNYGMDGDSPSASNTITLGDNSDAINKDAFTITGDDFGIYTGYVYFYDGTIIGKDAEDYDYILDRSEIKGIPAGATYNIVKEDGKTKCWLVLGSEFLYNERLDRKYRSFNAVYEDIDFRDGDIIDVLEDSTSEAIIDNNTHTYTLDLMGHTVSNTQPIKNSGTLTVRDSIGGGILQGVNPTSSTPAIDNTGTLNIQAGTIVGAYNAINNNGTLNQTGGTVKVSGEKSNAAIYSKGGSVEVTNATVTAENGTSTSHTIYGIYFTNGTVTVTDSTIATDNSTGDADCIREDHSNVAPLSVGVYGSILTANSENSSAFGISGGKATVKKSTVTNNPTKVTVTGKSADGIDTDSDNSNIYDAIIDVTTGSGNATGVEDAGEVEGNTITVTSTSGAAYGVDYAKELTSNTVVVTGRNASYGVRGRNFVINSGTTTVKSTNNNAYGYYSSSSSSYWSRNMKILGGTVTATTEGDGKLAYGYYTNEYTSSLITGGEINGGDYGIYNESGRSDDIQTIGVDDGTIYNGVDNSLATPVISGGQFGAYGGIVYLFDGRIRGNVSAYFDRNIKTIATDSYMHGTQETGYDDVKYVSVTEALAKIGSGSCPAIDNVTCFPSLQTAIAAAGENDTITLLKDNYVFEYITIPAEKKITIELDGHTIVTGAKITNYGKTTIQNTSSTRPVLDYHENNFFFINKANAELTMKGFDITTDNFVSNEVDSSLVLDGMNVNHADHSANKSFLITGYGDVEVKNGSVLSSNEGVIEQLGGKLTVKSSELDTEDTSSTLYYMILAKNCEVEIDQSVLEVADTTRDFNRAERIIDQTNATTTITGSTMENGNFDITSGTIEIKNSTYTNNHTVKSKSIEIAADGSMTLSNSTFNLVPAGNFDNNYSDATIRNKGVFNITNNSKVKIISDTREHNESASVGIVNSGTMTVDGSTITINTSSPNSRSYSRYGIYNYGSSSSLYIKNKSLIDIDTNMTGETYGIYADNSSTDEDKGIYLDGESTIDVSAPKAYGVYVKQGKFVMGVREGTQTDTSSKSWPLIKAISNEAVSGATGIGMTKINGYFNFYDGKIVGSTHSRQSEVSETEYWCDVIEGIDSDGYEYSILRFLPDGDGA